MFPPGIIHTTLSDLGALGAEAVTFKTAELAELSARSRAPEIAIGNTESDAEAFANAGIAERYLYQLMGNAMGGTIFADYAELVSDFNGREPVCR